MSEYAYCALLLHAAKKEINEENVAKVLEAAGIKADKVKVKALVESLKNVDIDKVLEEAVLAPTPVAEKKEEKKKEEEEKEKGLEEATAGLEALFK